MNYSMENKLKWSVITIVIIFDVNLIQVKVNFMYWVDEMNGGYVTRVEPQRHRKECDLDV